MSLYKNAQCIVVLACFLALSLTACGFHPLYQNTNTFAGQETVLNDIEITDISGVNGLDLRNNLIDRFYNNGRPDNACYTLNIMLEELGRNIVIQKNDTTTRAQLVLRANYRLLDNETRQEVDSGTIRAVSSYNLLPSHYTTLVTQSDARDMAVRELADKMTSRIAVVLQEK
ncbi:MAG: hypothetical protein JWM96_2 [Alphaproteobacteria bacterium]|nr:hypothetical protein [Alphaproteobacteria bacterium]